MAIFGGVEDKVLDYLLRGSRFIAVMKGDYFFREGDLADSMYVLEKGHVIVYRKWKGADYKLRELQENDCFGEMALLDCQPRSASVFAVEECAAIEITAAQLSDLYLQFTEQFILIHMNMAREVCRRLRTADQSAVNAPFSSANFTSFLAGWTLISNTSGIASSIITYMG